MAFPPDMLSKDEEVVLDLRPHWWYITPQAAALAAALLIGIVVLVNTDGTVGNILKFIVGIAILAALIWFGRRYAQWSTTNFVVTNERVISRTGVVSKNGIEIPLDRINTVFFNQGVFERLIGAGDLGIESAGEGGRQTFEDIRKPKLVQSEIYRQMEGYEERRLGRMGAAVGQQQVVMQEDSIPDQIAKLDQLRQSGAITQAEFDTKKAELLKRL